MLRTVSLLAFLASAAPLVAQVTPAQTRPDTTRATATNTTADSTARRTAQRDSAIVPAADQARGVDAEIRIALYDLLGDRYIPALSRLQWLAGSPVVLTNVGATGALRGRDDLNFLLSQTYYRLGMDSAFRATANQLTTGPSSDRFGRLLRTQLLLDAYRHGDYAGVSRIAGTVGTEDRGLAALVTGLAAYQTGDLRTASQQFAAAQSSGGTYAPYAQYMAALATLRADTTQRAPVLQALESVASSATGELQDQVRLTAAQVAYEGGRFDDAARLASQVTPSSGLAAEALLTRAWALYKANDLAGAQTAFADFATRYPQLPERDESRLMSGQALLQLGRTADAASVFRTVADSATGETQLLQTKAQSAMTDAARALVKARAAGLLFLNDPENGKTIALDDAAGSEAQVLAQAFSDSATAIVPSVSAADIISLNDITQRVDSLTPASGVPQRVIFAPASATTNPQMFAQRSQALYSADVAVVLAQHQLAELLAAQQRQIQMLQALQSQLNARADTLNAIAGRIGAARDSLARLASALDAAGMRLRQMFAAQINTTRMLANENRAAIDSVRTSLSGAQAANEFALLDIESQTAATYLQFATTVEQGLDQAISHHPVFAKRDSVNARGARLAQLLTESQNTLASTRQTVNDEIARLQNGGSDRIRGLQSALAAAEAQRTAAENAVVAVVDAELRARATEMIASLKRDTEAAQFGSASASFFQALDTGTTGTTGATSSASIGAARGTPARPTLPTSRDTQQQK